MTMPAEPATGTPAPATGDPSQQPIPTLDDDDHQQPATGDDWASAFEGLTPAQVRKKLDNSRKWEDRAKKNYEDLQAELAKGEPEAEDWQTKYETEQQRADDAEIRAIEMAYENTVARVARDVGADGDALMDSQEFRDKVAEELEDEFDDDELKTAVAKVAKQFAKRPRFAAQLAAGRSGGDFTGSPGAAASIDQQIADAETRKDFGAAIALKRQKAALTRK